MENNNVKNELEFILDSEQGNTTYRVCLKKTKYAKIVSESLSLKTKPTEDFLKTLLVSTGCHCAVVEVVKTERKCYSYGDVLSEVIGDRLYATSDGLRIRVSEDSE